MIGPLLLDIARDLGVSFGTAGLLATATAVPQALGSPFAGRLSDRAGRRPVLVFALSGIGLLALAASAAPGFLALATVRFLAGLIGSPAPISLMAAGGDLFPIARRARAMGWVNMGFSLAALVGVPLMGAVGGAFGWRLAFASIGGALLVIALCTRVWFPRGDRFGKLGIFITAQLAAGGLGLVLFGFPLAFPAAVAMAALVGLASAASRPPFLAFGSEVAPGQRGAMFGLVALTNQLGLVLGSALGALVIELAAPRGLAIVTLGQGLAVAGLVLRLALLRAR